jgi:hypothetical protein
MGVREDEKEEKEEARVQKRRIESFLRIHS